jgi:hypothetical protein
MSLVEGVELQIKQGLEPRYAQWARDSQDSYARAAIDFAQLWAKLMQLRMLDGSRVADIAGQAAEDANVGKTWGGAYVAAAVGLGCYWVHGEELLVWFRKQGHLHPRDTIE